MVHGQNEKEHERVATNLHMPPIPARPAHIKNELLVRDNAEIGRCNEARRGQTQDLLPCCRAPPYRRARGARNFAATRRQWPPVNGGSQHGRQGPKSTTWREWLPHRGVFIRNSAHCPPRGLPAGYRTASLNETQTSAISATLLHPTFNRPGTEVNVGTNRTMLNERGRIPCCMTSCGAHDWNKTIKS